MFLFIWLDKKFIFRKNSFENKTKYTKDSPITFKEDLRTEATKFPEMLETIWIFTWLIHV